MQNIHLCFETVANEVRMHILHLLKNKPMNVNELTEQLGIERTRVSHSLQMLRDCKFVKVEKKGKERIYELNPQSPLFSETQSGVFPAIQTHKEKVCLNCYKHKN